MYHKVGALFLMLFHLITYMVDETTDFGRASLRRTSQLVESFGVVEQGVRAYRAQNAHVSASAQFNKNFV